MLLALVVGLLRAFLPATLASVASPLWAGGSIASAGVGSVLGSFQNAAALRVERDRLSAENAQLRAELSTATAERADIRELALEGGRIVAGVVARPPVSPYDTLVVSYGTQTAPPVGALAYGPGAVPIGTVTNAGGSYARITLYSSSGTKVEGWVGDQRLPLTLVGAGAGTFTADLPKDAPVAVGDTVYLPGPGPHAAGAVVAVTTNPSSPRAGIRVRALINPFSLTSVSVSDTTP